MPQWSWATLRPRNLSDARSNRRPGRSEVAPSKKKKNDDDGQRKPNKPGENAVLDLACPIRGVSQHCRLRSPVNENAETHIANHMPALHCGTGAADRCRIAGGAEAQQRCSSEPEEKPVTPSCDGRHPTLALRRPRLPVRCRRGQFDEKVPPPSGGSLPLFDSARRATTSTESCAVAIETLTWRHSA